MPAIKVSGAEQFARLAAQLSGPANADLRKRVSAGIRARANPIVADVRTKVRSLPVTGSSGGGTDARHKFRQAKSKTGRARARGLRESIAAATGVQVRLSGRSPEVRIVVRSSGLPPDQRGLPRALDRLAGWRHPVFGHRGVWVAQRGRPYFASTIKRHAPAVRADIIAAIDQVAADIAKSAKK